MRRQSGALGNHGGVQVAQPESGGRDPLINTPDDATAVYTFKGGIVVGEMSSKITRANGAQQSVRDGVQEYVTIGVGLQTSVMGNDYAPDDQSATVPEAMCIESVAYTHYR